MSDAAQSERVDWLCGCGNGLLNIPVDDVPAQCGLCGQTFPLYQDEDE